MESLKKTVDTSLTGSRTGAGPEVKKKRQKLSLSISLEVFKPNLREITQEEENKLFSDNTTSAMQDISILFFIDNEMKAVIKHLNPKKVLGCDLIINEVLQKLPEMRIKYIIQLCNAIFRRDFFPPPPMEGSTNYNDPETW